jgi:hypothetical protein
MLEISLNVRLMKFVFIGMVLPVSSQFFFLVQGEWVGYSLMWMAPMTRIIHTLFIQFAKLEILDQLRSLANVVQVVCVSSCCCD